MHDMSENGLDAFRGAGLLVLLRGGMLEGWRAKRGLRVAAVSEEEYNRRSDDLLLKHEAVLVRREDGTFDRAVVRQGSARVALEESPPEDVPAAEYLAAAARQLRLAGEEGWE